jgi:hypothetical protein
MIAGEGSKKLSGPSWAGHRSVFFSCILGTLIVIVAVQLVHRQLRSREDGEHGSDSRIPANLPPTIVDALNRLSSLGALERGYACEDIFRGHGGNYHVCTSVAPFLVEMLADTNLYNARFGLWTPGDRAALALSSLGEPGLLALLKASGSDNPAVRYNSAFGLCLFQQSRSEAHAGLSEALSRLSTDQDLSVREKTLTWMKACLPRNNETNAMAGGSQADFQVLPTE